MKVLKRIFNLLSELFTKYTWDFTGCVYSYEHYIFMKYSRASYLAARKELLINKKAEFYHNNELIRLSMS